jgi:outer membrane protein OmpA-like peptidoglycan-associated protein
MNRCPTARIALCALLLLILPGGLAAAADDLSLNSVLYSAREKSDVDFKVTERAPKAKLEGTVRVESNQAVIELSYSKLEPALLFGGDVNAWVVWAVTPDGLAENLGELPVREDRSGTARFSSPHLNFAMLVTAEPFPGVRRPSDLMVFISQPVDSKYVRNSPTALPELRAGTPRDVESIADLRYEDKTPVELLQARKALDLLTRNGGDKHAPQATQDARVALAQATDAYEGRVGSKGDVPEYARRAIVSSTVAARELIKALETQRAEEQDAKRQAQLDALGQQATQAEKRRAETAATLAEVDRQRDLLEAETARLNSEKAQLQRERDQLAQRLSGALGRVSKTEQTGRGLVLSLSGGVLFDTGKSALKTTAKIALAKLAGILLMIPETRIQVEGHTDDVGSPETNQKLSLARAQSVTTFLQEQGVEDTRMAAQGLGPSTPVAPNDSAENRARNRRVEVIFAERHAR